jgi:uncharacterized protein (TIGR02466 family)
MNDFEILPLFPLAVLKTKMKRSLTKAELKSVNKFKTNMRTNIGNQHSLDTFVLDKPEFKDIREFIDLAIEDYMDNIVQPKYDTSCYVTQSWLNWTEPGGFHHSHYHPNSFISGVFYINANGNSDRIDFAKEKHDHFDIEAGEYNLYNSKTWWVGVSTGVLVLFPSHIIHSVPATEGGDVRISLAFNTYLKGQLGEPQFANELILK